MLQMQSLGPSDVGAVIYPVLAWQDYEEGGDEGGEEGGDEGGDDEEEDDDDVPEEVPAEEDEYEEEEDDDDGEVRVSLASHRVLPGCLQLGYHRDSFLQTALSAALMLRAQQALMMAICH